MRADPSFTVRESVASQLHVAEQLFPDAPDDVVRRVQRRVENRLAARLSLRVSRASLDNDARALIKRTFRREAHLHSADLERKRLDRDSPNELRARGAAPLTYLEALIDVWLRAGFTTQEIAAEQCSSARAVRRLHDRARTKLRRTNV